MQPHLGRGSYTMLFDHMAFDHNFSVGQPDNLVYINELLDLLEGKLENLVTMMMSFPLAILIVAL